MKYTKERAKKEGITVLKPTFEPKAYTVDEAADLSGKKVTAIHLALRYEVLNAGVVLGLNGKLVLADKAWETFLKK